METFKASLQEQASFLRQLPAERLQERLLDGVLEVHQTMSQFYSDASAFVDVLSQDPRPQEERYASLEQSAAAFRQAQHRYRMVFPKDLAERLAEFEKTLRRMLVRYRHADRYERADTRWGKLQSAVDRLVEDKLPLLFSDLEKPLRELLGSEGAIPPGTPETCREARGPAPC